MQGNRQLTLHEAIDILPRRPAILLGPAATAPFGAISYAIRSAITSTEIPAELIRDFPDAEYAILIDALRSVDSAKADLLEENIRSNLRQLPASMDMGHLVRAGWSACVSLTQDSIFERTLREHLDSLPMSRSVTMVDHPSVQPPQRTIPIYKLLGSLDNREAGHTLALAASDLALRQQEWHLLLKTLADHVRDAPLFCIGTESSAELVKKALATLLAMPKPNISSVMFLRSDPTLKDPVIRVMVSRVRLFQVDSTLREFCSAVAEMRPKQGRLHLGYLSGSPQEGLISAFEGTASFVSLVPTSLPAGFDPAAHRNALVDALFRPTSVDWAPYLIGMDLRREVAGDLKARAKELLAEPTGETPKSILLLGEAGVGKTAVAKRVACELAAEGVVVLWAKRAVSGTWMRSWRELSNEISKVIRRPQYRNSQFVVFCDDPYALRIEATELMTCFERFRGKLIFVFVLRNSDYYTSDGSISLSLPQTTEQIDVPYVLTEREVDGMATMLVKVGASANDQAAREIVARNPSPNAKDVLCSLWYLVPETQGQLTQSLEDQYRRLQNIGESISEVAQRTASASHVARRAYEFVTVTSNLDMGLPMEVLVRALSIDYAEWTETAANGRPLWGLLYDDYNEEESTIVYRTRNEVVTRVLLNLVNGGVGHAGEFRVLQELLRACDGGAPLYRNFVLDLLARGRNKLAKVVGYEQGLELFQIAEEALPFKDRILEHHKGIWMAQVGRDFKAAYAQYEVALETQSYPGAERDSPTEHIHTSMAAAVVQLVRHGEQSRESGLESVRNHLRTANSSASSSAHSSHVAANLLFELAKHNGVIQQDEVGLRAMGEALSEIERAIQMIGARGRNQIRFAKSIEILDRLRVDILSAVRDLDQMKDAAMTLFQQSGSQAGFEAVARCLLSRATHSDKGRSFNVVQEYITSCERLVTQAGKELSAEMRGARADLLIRWRVQRPSGQIDWALLRKDLEAALTSPRYRDHLLKRFYLAVALYHLGQITDGNVVFSGLRRTVSPSLSPNDIRCFLLGREGSPKRLQCTLEKGQGRFYATMSELGTDAPVHSPPSDLGPGSTTHCYVGFALNGPLAIFHRPDDSELMLA